MGHQVVTQKDLDLVPKKPATPTQSALGGGVAGVEEDRASDVITPPAPNDKKDQFTDRLLKYIPAEVVVVYVFVEGLIRNAPADVPRENACRRGLQSQTGNPSYARKLFFACESRALERSSLVPKLEHVRRYSCQH